MERRYIYLAGPIGGCSYDEATDWRDEIVTLLSPGIVGISPMRIKEWCKNIPEILVDGYEKAAGPQFLISGESHAIRTRDYYDVGHCDMIFAYLPKFLNERRPSWGTAIEIGWASAQRKPIVLVTDDDYLATHPLARESVGWIVPTLAVGAEVVNSVFNAYLDTGRSK